MQTSPRVDAHHHVWDLTQRDQEWTIGLPALRRSFSMDDLVPQLKECGVVATVVVQTVNLAEETPELLCLAEECSWIVGVVGWVDLRAPSVRDQLDELSQLPGGEHLVGIRHVVQRELDPNWLRHPNNLRGLRAVGQAGLVYDVLIHHDQIESAVIAAQTLPEVKFVIDHCGKPPIADGHLEPWQRGMTELARCENVAVKLSGLVTEADNDNWSVSDLRPCAEIVLDLFGSARVMFGSDWPTCQTAATYRDVVVAARELTSELSADEIDDVFGRTAIRWYRLEVS